MVMVVAISVAVFVVEVAMMLVARLVSRFGFNGYTVDTKFV